MRKQKKLLAVILSIIMIFSLAACGNNSNDGETIFNVATSGGYDTIR